VVEGSSLRDGANTAPLNALLASTMGCPTLLVNDAHAAAGNRAEWHVGTLPPHSCMPLVSAGSKQYTVPSPGMNFEELEWEQDAAESVVDHFFRAMVFKQRPWSSCLAFILVLPLPLPPCLSPGAREL